MAPAWTHMKGDNTWRFSLLVSNCPTASSKCRWLKKKQPKKRFLLTRAKGVQVAFVATCWPPLSFLKHFFFSIKMLFIPGHLFISSQGGCFYFLAFSECTLAPGGRRFTSGCQRKFFFFIIWSPTPRGNSANSRRSMVWPTQLAGKNKPDSLFCFPF